MDFYVEWDEEFSCYCVFDTEEGKAWESYASKEEAERQCQKLNEHSGII